MIPPKPSGLPDEAEFMLHGACGDLWFVPTYGQHGAVYVDDPEEGLRFSRGGKDYDVRPANTTKEGNMPATATKTESKAPKSEFAKLLEDGSDRELHAFLTKRVTYSDSTWKARAGRKTRKDGESRQAFLDRVLLGTG